MEFGDKKTQVISGPEREQYVGNKIQCTVVLHATLFGTGTFPELHLEASSPECPEPSLEPSSEPSRNLPETFLEFSGTSPEPCPVPLRTCRELTPKLPRSLILFL